MSANKLQILGKKYELNEVGIEKSAAATPHLKHFCRVPNSVDL